MSECVRDQSPTGDGAQLCRECSTALRTALEALASLLPGLTTVAAKMTAQGPRTGTIARTGHGDGISVHPLDVADEVRAVVTPWVRALVEEQVIDPDLVPERLDNGPVDTAALCSHLASSVKDIRLSDLAGDLAADILEPQQSLVMGYNDDGVPDTAAHYPPGQFTLAPRPPLVQLCQQVIDTGRDADIGQTLGDRKDEAMGTFMEPRMAWALVVEGGVKITERQVRRWIGEDRMLMRRTMEGDVLVMPSSLVELAASVRRGRPAA